MSTLKFAANLSWLYTDLPFLDRFEAAARDGFQGVECMYAHEHDTQAIRARLEANGLALVLFNARPGEVSQGDKGLASLPGREADFQRSIHEALERATSLNCPNIHVMAGTPPLATPEARQEAWQRYEHNLRWAAEQAAQAQRTLTIEPINLRDFPGYLLNHQAPAHALIERIGSPHLRLQMDLYHCQIMDGDVTRHLREALPSGRVAHMQIAAIPDRGEPNTGELAWPWVFDVIREVNWDGWIGCEYRPRSSTSEGLDWLRALRQQGLAI